MWLPENNVHGVVIGKINWVWLTNNDELDGLSYKINKFGHQENFKSCG